MIFQQIKLGISVIPLFSVIFDRKMQVQGCYFKNRFNSKTSTIQKN